ncbi:nucleotide excision repair endonuclease [candidate division KSB1 bacterium]|nr:nucleotide excision repair endonuclease [candidate division KSB1 bacterium]
MKQQHRLVTTRELITRFFYTDDNYPEAMEQILRTMLHQEKQIECVNEHSWKLRSPEILLKDIQFAVIDFEYIIHGHNQQLPVGLIIQTMKNGKTDSLQKFNIRYSTGLSKDASVKISKLQHELMLTEPFDNQLKYVTDLLANNVLVHFTPNTIQTRLNYLLRQFGADEVNLSAIALYEVAKIIYPELKARTLQAIAEAADVHECTDVESCEQRIELVSQIWERIQQQLNIQSITTWAQFEQLLASRESWVSFDRYAFSRQDIESLPESPGVYRMLDEARTVFYVGKSTNLRRRVRSYFLDRFDWDDKHIKILERIFTLEYELSGNELDALLFENRTINKSQPEINTQMQVRERPIDVADLWDKQLIIILAGVNESFVIFMLNDDKQGIRLEIQQGEENWNTCERLIKTLFFEKHGIEDSLSNQELMICWRWWAKNKEYINTIQVQKLPDVSACLTQLKQLINDPDIFQNKMVFINE